MRKNHKMFLMKKESPIKISSLNRLEELSNTYKIDVDLEEFAEGYIANIYLDYGCYTEYIKKLLAILFILADDISFLDGKKKMPICFSASLITHTIFS